MPESIDIISSIGALITAGLGLMGLISPDRAAKFTSMKPDGLLGVSEIRATYGGLFLALGAACLWLQHDAAFMTAGIAWMGAAVGRIISMVVDRNATAVNAGGVAFEGVIGALLLL